MLFETRVQKGFACHTRVCDNERVKVYSRNLNEASHVLYMHAGNNQSN